MGDKHLLTKIGLDLSFVRRGTPRLGMALAED